MDPIEDSKARWEVLQGQLLVSLWSFLLSLYLSVLLQLGRRVGCLQLKQLVSLIPREELGESRCLPLTRIDDVLVHLLAGIANIEGSRVLLKPVCHFVGGRRRYLALFA